MLNNTLGSIISMLFGSLLMMQMVVTLNTPVAPKEEVLKQQTRIVAVKKIKKRIVKKEQPKERPKQKTKLSHKAPPPIMNTVFGGLAMNIPEFDVSNIGGDSRELLEDISKDTVMTEDTADSKPRASYRAPIEYPERALEEGVEGYVVMHLLIGKDGSIQLAKVLKSEPEGVFDSTVLSNIQDWKFTPARYKGESVSVWVKQKISFNL